MPWHENQCLISTVQKLSASAKKSQPEPEATPTRTPSASTQEGSSEAHLRPIWEGCRYGVDESKSFEAKTSTASEDLEARASLPKLSDSIWSPFMPPQWGWVQQAAAVVRSLLPCIAVLEFQNWDVAKIPRCSEEFSSET